MLRKFFYFLAFHPLKWYTYLHKERQKKEKKKGRLSLKFFLYCKLIIQYHNVRYKERAQYDIICIFLVKFLPVLYDKYIFYSNTHLA